MWKTGEAPSTPSPVPLPGSCQNDDDGLNSKFLFLSVPKHFLTLQNSKLWQLEAIDNGEGPLGLDFYDCEDFAYMDQCKINLFQFGCITKEIGSSLSQKRKSNHWIVAQNRSTIEIDGKWLIPDWYGLNSRILIAGLHAPSMFLGISSGKKVICQNRWILSPVF